MLYTKDFKTSNKFGCEYLGTYQSIPELDEPSSRCRKQLGTNPCLFYLRFRGLGDSP